MNVLAILCASFLWIIAIILVFHTLKRWNDDQKQDVKYSELVQVGLFIVMGFYVLFLITASEQIERRFYSILLWIYSTIAGFFLFFNVFPNYLKWKLDPEYRKSMTYEKFLSKMQNVYDSEEEAEKADKVKDLSRKILHLLQFSAYVLVYEWSIRKEEIFFAQGLQPYEFRNFLLFTVGGFFWIMMMTGDLVRMENWKLLPKWAHKWFEKSLEPEREAWTINSATSILLANFLFLHPAIPIQVFFSAAFSSCIGDAFASVVGKNWGNHKLASTGSFPHKSLEGLIAGMLSTFFGVFLIFYFFPLSGCPLYAIFVFSTSASVAVGLIDLYVVKIADNIANSVVSGLLIYLLVSLC